MKRLLAASVLFLPALFCFGQKNAPDLDARLPVDPSIRTGRLSNGLTYYVRENHRPEKRAELRLAVNVGSVLEDEDQRGLAHFCEHMAFNGTARFRKQELVNYLESVGVRLGPDLNAYTSFDETVYMLQVPTDSAAVLAKAFDILDDWGHAVSYDDDEIDRERGVVIEEWRLGRGAEARIRDKQFPILFEDSRYAERLPIGQKEILESCPHDVLRRFYRQWYRPDLMAVIAVGDFDGAKIEELIRREFSTIPTVTPERPRELFPVPDNRRTLYAIATDPEATTTNVTLYFKHAVEPDSTVADYRRRLVEDLYNGMLNERLNELARLPDPPFVGAFSYNGTFVRTKDFYALGATVKDGGAERGLNAILTEAARVRTYGFTPTELEREKKNLLRGYERAFEERDKTESSSFAAEEIRNFLSAEPIPGIAYEYSVTKSVLPGITLAEVNRLASEWITDDNRLVALSAPQKPGAPAPTEAELSRVMEEAARAHVEPYVDRVADQPLVGVMPSPGMIVNTSTDRGLGTTTWTLSNGVRVAMKPTDFKNDEVLFAAYSPGGTSLVADSDFISATMATSVMSEGGVAGFDKVELQKLLAGKIVFVSPFIGEHEQGLNGSASPQDLMTMFQLIYLNCTAPRLDTAACRSLLTRTRAMLHNRSARPESAFEDTVRVTMAQHHFRARPVSEDLLAELDPAKSLRIYSERFADAGDFTFIFVGNFTPDSLRPMVLTYLGGLPAVRRHETWVPLLIPPPKGIVEKTVRKGQEPKSQVRIIFSGPFTWSPEDRHALSALVDVMRIRLRETLREEKGGTYGVGVGAMELHYPRPGFRLTISFGCAPERVDELTKAAFVQIDSIQRFGPAESYIEKVREIERRAHQTELRQNGYWLNSLLFSYVNNEDPDDMLAFDRRVDSVTVDAVRAAAQQYFTMNNFVKVVQYPEASDEGSGKQGKSTP